MFVLLAEILTSNTKCKVTRSAAILIVNFYILETDGFSLSVCSINNVTCYAANSKVTTNMDEVQEEKKKKKNLAEQMLQYVMHLLTTIWGVFLMSLCST